MLAVLKQYLCGVCKRSQLGVTHSLNAVFYRMGWEWSPVLMNPSKDLNKLRAYMRQALGPQAIPRYRPIILSEVMKLLKILVGFEADPADTINRLTF